MMKNEVDFLKGEYHRIGEMMKAVEPGSEKYKELLFSQQKIYSMILEEEKAMAEIELKEAEFDLKEQEAKKLFFKRFEFWSLMISGFFATGQLSKVIKAETGGAILNSRALSFVHKIKLR